MDFRTNSGWPGDREFMLVVAALIAALLFAGGLLALLVRWLFF